MHDLECTQTHTNAIQSAHIHVEVQDSVQKFICIQSTLLASIIELVLLTVPTTWGNKYLPEYRPEIQK